MEPATTSMISCPAGAVYESFIGTRALHSFALNTKKCLSTEKNAKTCADGSTDQKACSCLG